MISLLQKAHQTLLLAFASAVFFSPGVSNAQTASEHLIGTGELLEAPTSQNTNMTPTPLQRSSTQAATGIFILRHVIIDGHSSVPQNQLRTIWSSALGHFADARTVQAIVERVGALEAQSGIVLYTISIPRDPIINGDLHVDVVEGYVSHVVISGNTNHQKLGLLLTYANRVLANRPLKRAVLERNILLMGDLAGAKIGSRFIPVPGQPEQATLALTLKPTDLFGGFDLNNQGAPFLDNTQIVLNGGVNNLFREGERTQIIVGLPLDITRYQYYGVNDVEPLGGSGTSLLLSAGEFINRADSDGQSGSAQVVDIGVVDPWVRSLHQNIQLSVNLGYLNSNNAYLGFTTSDERTRDVQVEISYNDDKYLNGLNRGDISLTQGLNILGARQASIAYGTPVSTKFNFDATRIQVLPLKFVLRLRATGQFSEDRLPPSEEFEFGGPDYGEAFYAAELTGDSGFAVQGELDRMIPTYYLPKVFFGSSWYVMSDYGQIWNASTPYAAPTDRAASFGFGMKMMISQKLSLQIGVAKAIVDPMYAKNSGNLKVIIATTGHF